MDTRKFECQLRRVDSNYAIYSRMPLSDYSGMPSLCPCLHKRRAGRSPLSTPVARGFSAVSSSRMAFHVAAVRPPTSNSFSRVPGSQSSRSRSAPPGRQPDPSSRRPTSPSVFSDFPRRVRRWIGGTSQNFTGGIMTREEGASQNDEA